MALRGSSWFLDERTAPRPHTVLRLSIAGIDFGADAWLARVGAAGYIEVWTALADADDAQTLVQIVGAPALPVVPRVRPAVLNASGEGRSASMITKTITNDV